MSEGAERSEARAALAIHCRNAERKQSLGPVHGLQAPSCSTIAAQRFNSPMGGRESEEAVHDDLSGAHTKNPPIVQNKPTGNPPTGVPSTHTSPSGRSVDIQSHAHTPEKGIYQCFAKIYISFPLYTKQHDRVVDGVARGSISQCQCVRRKKKKK